MMRRSVFALSSALLLLAAPAALADQISGTSAAEAGGENAQSSDRRCLAIHQIRRIEIIDDSTIHFHMRGGEHDYINHLPHRCSGLKSRGTFMHSTSTNNYCDLDTITVIDTNLGMRLASCPLGRFEAVDRSGRTEESSD